MPGVGRVSVTLISAGIPTVFVAASDLGFTGSELQPAVNSDAGALARLEAVRVRECPVG